MRNPDLASGRTADWEPFEISKEEYNDLIIEVSKINGLPFVYEEPPKGITNAEEWLIWQGVTKFGAKFKDKYMPHVD
jgi:hypothetical protein